MSHFIKAALIAVFFTLFSTNAFSVVATDEANPLPQSLLAVMDITAEQGAVIQPSAGFKVASGTGFYTNCFDVVGQYCAIPGPSSIFHCTWGFEPGTCICSTANTWFCF